MGAAIGLRNDFDAAGLRRQARTTKSANQGRRLLALAEIYDGGSRGDAARIGGGCWLDRVCAIQARTIHHRDNVAAVCAHGVD